MTPEQLAEIRVRAELCVLWTGDTHSKRDLIKVDIPALIAEIERLRADNDALRQAVKSLEKNQAKLVGRLADAEAY